MTSSATVLFVGALLAAVLCVAAEGAADYRYPYTDPYQATVYGTPPDQIHRPGPAVSPKLRAIRIEGRKVPDIFSYSADMFYSTALQKGEAPLIFIIAGTGAEHNAIKMEFLTQVFYGAGFHVVALSSPTHMNFVISASRHGAPGYVPHDVDDLYRVMLWIKEVVEAEQPVSEYYITGYSLGAMHAAFLAHRDSEKGDFGFRRALMINPPVSLYHSVKRLDSWLTAENLGEVTVREQIASLIARFSDYYRDADITDLDDNFLYEMVTRVNMDDVDLRTLIGVDFRLSASSMIFATDVCLRAGYLVPPADYPLTKSKPLMPYAEAAFDISFENYMDEFLLPYLQHLDPSMDRYTLMRQSSLYDIRSYLMESDKVVLIGNTDDVILNDNDLAFIKSVFGERARLYPTGGHCGNMMYGPFVEAMLAMVKL
ncbi:alpha/beta hydrolase [Pseudodesulfovibrio sp. F-1]|uniref:Alpha/beta hydrolase n=2 Tax=Pseudodesulfovibrio alkaliphilus TaxID=2661613 RepID=A0A7K1KPZ4_9BACT|nr:alpha/beta hydrolase [Pseudodesulfovibrio alkaliphilus]